MKKLNPLHSRIAVFIAILILLSCNDDPVIPPAPNPTEDPNIAVNKWIKENMDYFYLWNSTIPNNVDQSKKPDEYFKALLNSQDRFSWIQPNYLELLNSLGGISKEAGYELVFYRTEAGSSNLIAQIVYIKPESPASFTALKRGDVITKINNTAISLDNYRSLIAQLGENHTLSYRPLSIKDGIFGAEAVINLTTVEFAENPNFLSKVIAVNDRKVGYYLYNFFAPGNGNKYDMQMESIFAGFKAQGITDLVLDLRYNSGGAVSSALNLASHIAKGITSSSVFSYSKYNDKVEADIIKDPQYGPSYLVTNFLVKDANVGGQLTANRVYILTGSRTASASELIINGLKPYMNVFLIGATTVGKNVGSITIYEKDNPKNTWGMQPIIFKLLNKDKQADYSSGFTPDIINPDNSLLIYPLGDEKEALLSQALSHIAGISARVGSAPQKQYEIVAQSLDFKKRSNQLIGDWRFQELSHE